MFGAMVPGAGVGAPPPGAPEVTDPDTLTATQLNLLKTVTLNSVNFPVNQKSAIFSILEKQTFSPDVNKSIVDFMKKHRGKRKCRTSDCRRQRNFGRS